MQLTPRYGDDPIITLDGAPGDIAGPVIRQRRRLADTLAELTDDQWAHPSRCEGWSIRDVIVHLDTTNAFWCFSITQGLRGKPTELLTTFDPVASPAQLVEAAADVSTPEAFEKFGASTEAFIALLESLDDDGWTALAEAPPGHLSVSALAHHALWDSWIHERDILLPLGIDQEAAPDEITSTLRYAVALGPAYALTRGVDERGTLGVEATDPDLSIAVVIGDHVEVRAGTEVTTAELTLTGDAVELTEALSIRRPLSQPIPADVAWMVDGLATTFDTART